MQKVVEKIKENGATIIAAAVLIFMATLIILALYGSATQPKEGIVVRKNYYPSYTSTDYKTINYSDGSTARVPVQEYHEATYQIVIKGINSKGEEDLGYYYVTPMEYESIKIGDYYVKELYE